MKKIVPFKKELFFKNNISEITSISLEHTLHSDDDHFISGDFIISGEYRITDVSVNTDQFNFTVPFDISVDDKYIMDKVVVDIDDFNYEVINSSSLLINIAVMIDNLEEKQLVEERIELDDIIEDTGDDIAAFLVNNKEQIDEIVDEHKEEIGELYDTHVEKIGNIYDEKKDEIGDIFNDTKDNLNEYIMEKKDEIMDKVKDKIDEIKDFITYRIYILREDESIESVMNKYNISREELEQYNNLNDLRIGSKIIIPTSE